MRNLSVLLSLGLIFSFFNAACGADVEVEHEEPNGTENDDAGAPGICQAFCSVRVATGCSDDEAACIAACEQSFEQVGQCAPAYSELYRCAMENPSIPPECAIRPECQPLYAPYETCVASAPCEEKGVCNVKTPGEEVDCDCRTDCSGVILEAECMFGPDYTSTCDCLFNGEVVGSCTNNGNICPNILYGCCAGIFAASH